MSKLLGSQNFGVMNFFSKTGVPTYSVTRAVHIALVPLARSVDRLSGKVITTLKEICLEKEDKSEV